MSELFDADPLRIIPAEEPEMSAGARARRRQAAWIANGYHPLAGPVTGLRLHPDAPRVLAREDAASHGDYLRCGTCRFRENLQGDSARAWPKCTFGMVNRDMTPEELAARPDWQKRWGTTRIYVVPRATHGEATDVRAWWPACTQYQPKETTDER